MYIATRGMGDATSEYLASQNLASKNIQIGGTMAAGIATALAGSGALGVLGISTAALTAAVPFIGPALMAATMLVQYLVANSGCGITCVETSEWANQAADALQQVMDGYFALPAPRTVTQKALAVANFKTIWAQLQKACGQPGTGNAGVRCISDRQAGACTWKQKYAPVYPGEPNIGECWNWFNGYLGPIQADPVVPDPTLASQVATDAGSVGTAFDSIFTSSAAGGTNYLPLLLIGGLALWAVTS
jgi:hypothetical protein